MQKKKPSRIEINKTKNIILNHLVKCTRGDENCYSRKNIFHLIKLKFPHFIVDDSATYLDDLEKSEYIIKLELANKGDFGYHGYKISNRGKSFILREKFPETNFDIFIIWFSKPQHWIAILGLILGSLTLAFSYLAYINQKTYSSQQPSFNQPFQEVSPSDQESIKSPSIKIDSSELQQPLSPAVPPNASDSSISQKPS